MTPIILCLNYFAVRDKNMKMEICITHTNIFLGASIILLGHNQAKLPSNYHFNNHNRASYSYSPLLSYKIKTENGSDDTRDNWTDSWDRWTEDIAQNQGLFWPFLPRMSTAITQTLQNKGSCPTEVLSRCLISVFTHHVPFSIFWRSWSRNSNG